MNIYMAADTKFYMGQPCAKGHDGLRYKSTRVCVQCNKERWHNVNISEGQRLLRNERSNQWAKDNRNAVNAQRQRWLERYPAKRRASVRAAQAARLQRTPPWADLNEVRRVYNQCPEGMEVDHILPLRGQFVSGLHVPNNLQYLTPEANRKKGNR